MTAAAYDWWREAMAGRMHAMTETAQPGFYKAKSAGNFWLPVAIWEQHGEIICLLGKEPAKVSDVWLRCAKHPVSEEDYRHCIANGAWPGDAPPPAMGNNNPPEGFDALRLAIESEAAEALGWLKDLVIETQADADKCANWRDAINKLMKQADAEREKEKRPHMEAANAVQAKYAPLIARCKAVGDQMRQRLSYFLQKQQEAKRAAVAAAVVEGNDAVRFDSKASAGGSVSGRKTHLRTQTTAVITDFDAALAFFKSNEELRELVQLLANRVVRAGGTMPGVEVKREQVAA